MSKYFSSQPSDESIIDGIKNYDQGLASVAYEKHKDYCIRFMKAMYDDEVTIKDIYQDAVLVLIENIRHKHFELKKGSSMQTYLNSICRNQILVRFKSSKKIILIHKEEMEFIYDETIVDWLDDLSDDINNERMNKLKELMKKMQEDGGKCYELLILYYYQSRNMDFIANKLDYTNAKNAKNQKYRCLKKLKDLFKI